MLGHVTQAGPHPDGILPDIDTADLRTTLRRVSETEQDPEQGRLAGAVGADETDAPTRHFEVQVVKRSHPRICLLYTSDAADERSSVDLGGRRIIKKKKKDKEERLR